MLYDCYSVQREIRNFALVAAVVFSDSEGVCVWGGGGSCFELYILCI